MAKPGQKSTSDGTRKSAMNAVKSRPHKSQKFKHSDSISKNKKAVQASPQTCCSNCQTVFEVSAELLSTSDTRVRCGECLSIFDALANLQRPSQNDDISRYQDPSNEIQSGAGHSDRAVNSKAKFDEDVSRQSRVDAFTMAEVPGETSPLDSTYSDFDLFSSDAMLPDIQFSDNTHDVSNFNFDDVSDIDDETFSDTLFAQDATVDVRSLARSAATGKSASSDVLGGDVGFIHDDSEQEPLIFNYREDKEGPKDEETNESTDKQTDLQNHVSPPEPGSSKSSYDEEPPFDEPIELTSGSHLQESLNLPASTSSSWFLQGGLFFLALLIAGGLYAYRERDSLLNNEFVRPLLSTACELLSCKLPDQTDIDALRAVDRSVIMHPTVPNALIIKFGIINQANFSQPFPILEIRLTDRAGRLVVINQFKPIDYSRGWQPGDVLDTGKRLDIGLAVEDPGKTAMSFELDFYEVK